MKDFSTTKAVQVLDKANRSLCKLVEDWDACDTANGSEEVVNECSDPMGIVMNVKGLLDIAAGMLEDCTR